MELIRSWVECVLGFRGMAFGQDQDQVGVPAGRVRTKNQLSSACKDIFSSPDTPRRIGIDQIPDEQDTIPSCTKVN